MADGKKTEHYLVGLSTKITEEDAVPPGIKALAQLNMLLYRS